MAAAAIVAIGIIGVVIPQTLIAFRTDAVSSASLYLEALFKIVVGLALVLAAPKSRASETLLCIGVAIAFGGLAIPIFGVEGARERLAWESAHIMFFRFEAALFVLLGAIIVLVVSPRHSANDRQLSSGKMPEKDASR